MPRPKLPPDVKAAHNAARQARWRERAKERGLARINVPVTHAAADALKRLSAVFDMTHAKLLDVLLTTADVGYFATLGEHEKAALAEGTLRRPFDLWVTDARTFNALPEAKSEDFALAPTKPHAAARDRMILEHAAKGYGSRKISDITGIAESTVRVVLKRHGIKNRQRITD